MSTSRNSVPTTGFAPKKIYTLGTLSQEKLKWIINKSKNLKDLNNHLQRNPDYFLSATLPAEPYTNTVVILQDSLEVYYYDYNQVKHAIPVSAKKIAAFFQKKKANKYLHDELKSGQSYQLDSILKPQSLRDFAKEFIPALTQSYVYNEVFPLYQFKIENKHFDKKFFNTFLFVKDSNDEKQALSLYKFDQDGKQEKINISENKIKALLATDQLEEKLRNNYDIDADLTEKIENALLAAGEKPVYYSETYPRNKISEAFQTSIFSSYTSWFYTFLQIAGLISIAFSAAAAVTGVIYGFSIGFAALSFASSYKENKNRQIKNHDVFEHRNIKKACYDIQSIRLKNEIRKLELDLHGKCSESIVIDTYEDIEDPEEGLVNSFKPFRDALSIGSYTTSLLFGTNFLLGITFLKVFGALSAAAALTSPIGLGIAFGVCLLIGISLGYKAYRAAKDDQALEKSERIQEEEMKERDKNLKELETKYAKLEKEKEAKDEKEKAAGHELEGQKELPTVGLAAGLGGKAEVPNNTSATDNEINYKKNMGPTFFGRNETHNPTVHAGDKHKHLKGPSKGVAIPKVHPGDKHKLLKGPRNGVTVPAVHPGEKHKHLEDPSNGVAELPKVRFMGRGRE